MKVKSKIAAATLLVFGAAGCGDDGSARPVATSTSSEVTTTAATTAPAATLPSSTAPTSTSVVTTTTEAPQVLDLSPIAGDWQGMGQESLGDDRFVPVWIVVQIDERAEQNRTAARVAYYGQQSEHAEGRPPNCLGDWWVQAAAPPTYEFHEVILEGNCSFGQVRLEHHPQSGTLDYEWSGDFATTATLFRTSNDETDG